MAAPSIVFTIGYPASQFSVGIDFIDELLNSRIPEDILARLGKSEGASPGQAQAGLKLKSTFGSYVRESPRQAQLAGQAFGFFSTDPIFARLLRDKKGWSIL